MRRFQKPQENNHNQYQPPTLRTTKKAAIYARRSPTYAKDKQKDKTQSREMQTSDLLTWAIKQGWSEELLEPYFADFGMSGTLAPHERPDMLRLFDDIDNGKLDNGSIICFQENRLFRDETQIYYNQLIQKCKEHNIVVVAVSPHTMIYDFQDEFLTEMFRWKCKEAGEFIKRQVKGWMHPARLRAARLGYWSGLGDITIGYVVDIDPTSSTYKRFIPYEPHAKLVRLIFKRFMELAGDETKLHKELAKNPIVFPPLSEDEKKKYLLKNRMISVSGGMLRNRASLDSILTNRFYIGYRIVKGEIVNKSSHPAIIDTEVFAFAFITKTGRDLDGNILSVPPKTRRYYRRTPERVALLKDRIRGENGRVYVKQCRRRDGEKQPKDNSTYNYTYLPNSLKEKTNFSNGGYIELISVQKLDEMIVKRLFEHTNKFRPLPSYDEEIKKKREERARAITQIETSIENIPTEQARLAAQLAKTKNENVQNILLSQIESLEGEKARLQHTKTALIREQNADLQSLDEELKLLKEDWHSYPSDRRVALINFLIQEVVIDLMSPRWLRIRITWLYEEWGTEQMYLCRPIMGGPYWSEEEDTLIREHFPTGKRIDLVHMLPNRTWATIRERAHKKLRLKREIYERISGFPENIKFCVLDLKFMQEIGLDANLESTNWMPLYLRA